MTRTESTPNPLSAAFIEALYDDYLADPASVSPPWQRYFQELSRSREPSRNGGDGRAKNAAPRGAKSAPATSPIPTNGEVTAANLELAILQDRVDQLIRAYRVRGHMIARIDPLFLPRPVPPELDPAYYGLTEADMDRSFSTDTIHGEDVLPLRKILERLRNTYCRYIGAQFMHMDDLEARNWLQSRMESTENRIKLTRDEQLRILRRLSDAVIFEEFLQKRYLGAKTFSLEGAESLIPLLELAIEHAAQLGTDEIVFGMAHRGRLNVLANIMGKSARKIFREFEDADPELHVGRDDVKYHLGHSWDWYAIGGQKIHLSLCFNPSHLEFVNPVVLGRNGGVKQDRAGDFARQRGLALLIHGDAAFAGEGIVQETLNLSQLPAYTVGGTIHVVVNNQIGFTTAPNESRSSTYATDVAKMLQIPIFHVNGEDPEAVAQVVRLSLDFRQKFRRDVVIDMYCYRRRGHNEGDEPSFTQPLMYRAIENRDSVRDHYLERLLLLGGVTVDEAETLVAERREFLERELSVARSDDYVHPAEVPNTIWTGYFGGPLNTASDVDTALPREQLSRFLLKLTEVPDGFRTHPKIERLLEQRRHMAEGKAPLDWAAGEALALASLATAGVRIRVTGQDTPRGTFSQRHAALYDYDTGQAYVPLEHLADGQAPVEICNSPLSETGVLGFEYGYSLDCPDGLVMWEAQFGDFANAAQVIIDQFIASAEDKWRRLSGLALLLPHGFEGQGPEHSSARLERFLALAAEDNIQIVSPTTPAQYFHCLRRQALRNWRKPLIVMTPKSLLRLPQAISTPDDCAQGRFQRVLRDTRDASQSTRRILLCTGKIYYDLEHERRERKCDDIAIVRLEELYPFPADALREALANYADETPVVWTQEEPENMGAWHYLRVLWGERLFGRFPLTGLSRPASASPATGSASSHRLEQKAILTARFAVHDPAGMGALRERCPPVFAPRAARELEHEVSIMPIEFEVPTVGESITEVQIGPWQKGEGSWARKDESLVEIETDKATVELPAPENGTIVRILKQQGEKATVGEVIGYFEARREAPAEAAGPPIISRATVSEHPPTAATADSSRPAQPAAPAPASETPSRVMPAAQRILAEKNLSPADIVATGPGGRLLKEDVAKHVGAQPGGGRDKAPSTQLRAERIVPDELPTALGQPARSEKVVPMSLLRQRIAERLVEAQQTAALLTTFNEIDMSAVIELRSRYRESFQQKHGVKLGFMSFFVKASIDALGLFPGLNAEIRGTDVVYHNYYDVGVAIGGGKGLVVPVIRNAQLLSFAQIELAIADFGRRAAENKLELHELQGGTFTISNGGVYGSLLSTPIVNPPQSGILGLHAINERPIALDGQVVIRPMMYVALTYDHRLVDGREAVTFLRHIKEVIEDPSRLLLEV